jgi:hypothetical protein
MEQSSATARARVRVVKNGGSAQIQQERSDDSKNQQARHRLPLYEVAQIDWPVPDAFRDWLLHP